MNAKQLREQADELFSKRSSLMLLWQEIAENFYPERADFTVRRTMGTEFASNLMTSYPMLNRRELGDQIGSMLRPTNKEWKKMVVRDLRNDDHDARSWLEWANATMRRAMYDPQAQFTRATKEGDHDFACFGQNVISIEINRHFSALLYRCWHLRDVVWMENQDGAVCFVARRWKPACKDLCALFPGKVDPKVEEMKRKHPFKEVEVLHMVVEEEMYDDKAGGRPRWSIYYDCEHNKVIEATPIHGRIYVIPRWQTVSGSQYAFSPATIAALPDARLLQAMSLTLLEAGEKIVNPPMIATIDAVKSDMSIHAGGVTWVDREYDEKMGEALRPMTIDAKGIPLSHEMMRDTRAMLMQAFYLNKLTMPQRGPEMTAYEVGQRVQEYIRGALPLFEPMEMSYNGGLCDETFDVLMRAGTFGSPLDMPRSLSDVDVTFQFESPLHDAIEQQKGTKFLEMKQILTEAMAIDKNVAAIPDATKALRDTLHAIGVPMTWTRSESQVRAIIEKADEDAQSLTDLSQLKEGAEAVAKLGSAQRDIAVANQTQSATPV